MSENIFLNKLYSREFTKTENTENKEGSREKSLKENRGRFFKLDKISEGCWYTIHLCAARGDREALVSVVKIYKEAFSCPKCRGHINEYVFENPIPTIEKVQLKRKTRLELFDWTFRFHNSVNQRIGKEEMSYTMGLKVFDELTRIADKEGYEYITENKCESGCDGVVEDVPASTTEAFEHEYPKDSIGSVKFTKY